MGIKMWPFKADPHQQFEALLRPHLKQLYSLAYRLCGQRDDAEDLVQEILLKVFPRLEEMQGIEKLGPWLSRVLYRQFIDQYRRAKRSPIYTIEEESELYQTHSDHSPEPAQVTNSVLTLELLNKALLELNEDHRQLIMLHDVEGYKLQEISEMTDVPVGTLKSRHNRARSKLREILHKMEPETQFERLLKVTG